MRAMIMRSARRIVDAGSFVAVCLRTYPKRIEAIGLFVVLVAAFFQIQADGYQRMIANHQLAELQGEVSYTREKVMNLVACSARNDCNDWDYSAIAAESYSFLPLDAPERFSWWQTLRYTAFVIGSLLILLAKWNDERGGGTARRP